MKASRGSRAQRHLVNPRKTWFDAEEMIMDIPDLIPQLDPSPVRWAYFLHKCSTGSYYVADMLYLAEWALMEKLVGYPIYEEPAVDYDRVISSQFATSQPFASPGELLRQLVRASQVDLQITMSKHQRHDSAHYHSLWKRHCRVQVADLLHDAVLHSWSNWSAAEHHKLSDEVIHESLNYNSLHALVAMILLISTFKDKCPDAFKFEAKSSTDTVKQQAEGRVHFPAEKYQTEQLPAGASPDSSAGHTSNGIPPDFAGRRLVDLPQVRLEEDGTIAVVELPKDCISRDVQECLVEVSGDRSLIGLVIDCHISQYFDCSTIASFMQVRKQAQETNKHVVLCRLSDSWEWYCRTRGLNKIFMIVDDLGEALELIKGERAWKHGGDGKEVGHS
jgi:anti-anti-sigma regulatory factor